MRVIFIKKTSTFDWHKIHVMKKTQTVLLLLLVMLSCTSKKELQKIPSKEASASVHSRFGDPVTELNYLSYEEAIATYNTLKIGDTIALKFASNVAEVCAKKGCWMNLSENDSEEKVMVRFKDYGFFVPTNSEGSEVIVEGKAFLEKVSVSELKHYAMDAGRSSDEITQINTPKIEFSFEANGLLLKN